MVSGQRVLVVNGQSETEEVLKAILEPRGIQIDRLQGEYNHAVHAGSANDSPHLVVVHEKSIDAPVATHSNTAKHQNIPRVIIGSAVMPPALERNQHYLQHPFQYSELIQAIEQLLK